MLLATHARTWSDLANNDQDAAPKTRVRWFERASRSADRSGLYEVYARIRLELAQYQSRRGLNEQALVVIEALLARFEGQALVYRPIARLALAEVQRQLSHFSEALDSLDQAEVELGATELVAPGEPDPFWMEWYGLRGLVQLELGRWEQGQPLILEEYRRAREAYDANPGYLPYLLRSMGRRFDLEMARNKQRRALSLADDFISEGLYDGAPEQLALLNVQRGKALVRLERIEPHADRNGARTALESALQEDALLIRPRIDALLELAAIHIRDGRYQEADRRLAEASARIEALATSTDQVATEWLRATTLRSRLAIGCGLPVEELRGAREELSRSLDALLNLWLETPLLSGGVGHLALDPRPAALGEFARLNELIDESETAALSTIDLILKTESFSTFARTVEMSEVTPTIVRTELLSEAHGVLKYVFARDESWLIALDRDHADQYQLPGVNTLLDACDRHRLALLRGEDSEERGAAKTLADLLLPAEARARLEQWQKLTIVGSDDLPLIPFAVLPIRGEFLGCEIALDELPSLTVGVILTRRVQRERTIDFALVADSVPSQAALRLTGPLDELATSEPRLSALTRPYRRSRVLHRSQATESAALELGKHASVLQFLVHGVIDRARERRAGLVLTPEADGTDDGLVWAEDVEEQPTADFVLLTVCSSASAPARSGDAAPARLSTAFLARGARAVLEASADLSLEPTLALSRELHERLATGASPAEALRQARAAMVAAGWRSARHHGCVHLTGLGHRPPR